VEFGHQNESHTRYLVPFHPIIAGTAAHDIQETRLAQLEAKMEMMMEKPR